NVRDTDVILDERYHAGCCGIPDRKTVEAIKYGASMDAFITDPPCEGKSPAGIIDMIKNEVYAHLGGQLALNAYSGMD
ncbi:hypothetical protein B0H14DRAFT_2408812, partial [Mycena olivaceomarginata]